MTTIEIVVPTDVGRCSPNLRLCWQERSRRAKAARVSALLAWRMAGEPVAPGPVTVDLTIRRGRVMDQDNALSAFKPGLDSLFNGAITPNDSPRWVEYGRIRQETGRQWRDNPHVVVTVRERTG